MILTSLLIASDFPKTTREAMNVSSCTDTNNGATKKETYEEKTQDLQEA